MKEIKIYKIYQLLQSNMHPKTSRNYFYTIKKSNIRKKKPISMQEYEDSFIWSKISYLLLKRSSLHDKLDFKLDTLLSPKSHYIPQILHRSGTEFIKSKSI